MRSWPTNCGETTMAKPKKKEVDTLLEALNENQTHALVAFQMHGKAMPRFDPKDKCQAFSLWRDSAHLASVRVLEKRGVFHRITTHREKYVFVFSPLGKAAAQEAVERAAREKVRREAARAAKLEEYRLSDDGRKERVREIRMLRGSLQRYDRDIRIAVDEATQRAEEAHRAATAAQRTVWNLRNKLDTTRYHVEAVIKKLEEEVGLCHEKLELGTEADVRESLRPLPLKDEDEEE